MRSEGRSARTYVLVDGEDVIGYYCILTGGIDRGALPRRLAGDMPLIAPIVLIGRFAVDRRFQGKGVGRALLRDALKRCYAISQMAGVRAVLVHAIDEDARAFYLRAGFEPFPDHGRTLFLAIRHIAALI